MIAIPEESNRLTIPFLAWDLLLRKTIETVYWTVV